MNSAPIPSPDMHDRRRRLSQQRLLASLTLLLVLIAWLYGYLAGGNDIAALVADVVPGAVRVERRGDLLRAFAPGGVLLGYVGLGRASGYGGPVEVLVGVSPEGQVLSLRVVGHHETPGFFRLLDSQGFYAQFPGRTIDAPLRPGVDLDAVSGATLSSEAVASAVRLALRTVAQDGLQQSRPPERHPIRFGWPETILVLLYATGYVGHRLPEARWKRRLRWATLLAGMLVLGFLYTAPLTLAMVISFLSGYWPSWQDHIYWYLLLGGILFVTTTQGKNPYCSWFCPFGAYQECLGTLTGAKLYRPRRLHDALTWLQRGLALVGVLLGLALRRPGAASYEPFATLFDLRGTVSQWGLLLLVTVASLLVYRPFCNYLCPLAPVVDYIGEGRRWLRERVRQWHASRSSP
ncbi:MAG: FMN-binding protein [Anaerolineae bacterium]